MVDRTNFDIIKTMSTHLHSRSSGFTVIELIVVIVIISAATLLFFFQKNNLQTANLDERRKTAVNSIYYSLEEVFYAKNGYYPAEISSSNLSSVDPALLTDTNGVKIDDKEKSIIPYEYVYQPLGCDMDGKCKGYTLRTSLINEGEYVKKSRKS